ncbi:gamma carbonic anhydrase family protein [Microbacterium sp. G2-8]|uniref:gamma carbonic anhydrase family protein n=1 Tax=Microbacterium sp. G2-8 TaxID=2842454 RepID=UPI001C8A910E|nr:gamma carbonic anhydrase family protein [Microbacterium sp. G2-8]
MTISAAASIRSLGAEGPVIDDSAFVAEGARIIGDVHLAESSSAWCNAVLRGDVAPIRIGRASNLQDNVTVHVDADHPTILGEYVSVGHNAVVHGCEIGDGTLIGMGSVVLSGARIGASCLIAGGAVVLEGTEIPPRSLVAGVPAKVRRELTDDEVARIRRNAERYVAHSRQHAASI